MPYDPQPGVILQEPWNITFLSTRDVALDIPINYVPTPGVAVSPACFAQNRYDEQTTTTCVSNLLAIGFRRLVIDLYWDAPRRTWSLCPVQIPIPGDNGFSRPNPGASSTGLPSGSPIPTATTGSLSAVSNAGQPLTSSSVTALLQDGLLVKDADNLTSEGLDSSVATITVNVMTQANTTAVTFQTLPVEQIEEEVFSNGPYVCSPTATLDSIISIIAGFLGTTDDTLSAVLRYMVFNIHAASPVEDATSPAMAPTYQDLPTPSESVGDIMNYALSRYIYTPSMLAADRSDVARSWLTVSNVSAPEPEYYSVIPGTSVSPDGWPSEGYMEFAHARRLLVGYGDIDPQMANYTNAADSQYVFSKAALSREFDVAFSPNGSVTDGCIFDPQNPSVESANSSWAADITDFSFPLNLLGVAFANLTLDRITNITACGVSPVLNATLVNKTADQDHLPYQGFLNNVVWSWSPGEPRLTPVPSGSSDDDDDDNDNHLFRCAAFSVANQGRWLVQQCQERHLGACRANGSPYVWRLSTDTAYYSEVDSLCPDGFGFAVPRTPLENRYLLEACKQQSDGKNDLIWLNFNSLDTENCWVTGVNATCAYSPSPMDNTKQIVVPTIVAIIILALTACTLLLKCGSNRRTSRRRRRVLDGWDYEGVPS